MPLKYLLDEHLRGLLWRHVQRHNLLSEYALDVIQLGDSADLPLGSEDPQILLWAERENRIVVSRDERTMPKYLREHIAGGHHSPGIFLARPAPLSTIVEFLMCAAYASEPAEWVDRVAFIS